MKLRTLAVAAVVLLSATMVLAQAGKGGGQGGQRGGGMRGMMGVDQEWAALCFQINISADQIAKLRPTFAWAWKARQSAIKTAMASRNFEAAGKTMAQVQSTVDARVKTVLTSAQRTQLAKWKTDQAAARAKMRGGGQGGGQRK